jgi:hypothetical protein
MLSREEKGKEKNRGENTKCSDSDVTLFGSEADARFSSSSSPTSTLHSGNVERRTFDSPALHYHRFLYSPLISLGTSRPHPIGGDTSNGCKIANGVLQSRGRM